ncbi:MAG: enoyl-CoA hydratase/isomerase family protein [Hyphomicrobiales bacterium]|nr:enoyl-CoA hydratase/isomerase family protein [Hyphomicrobiales bacterium]
MPATDQLSTTPILTVSEGRALIRLNRPREHNRIEPADLRTLREHFDRVDSDPSIRVLVVTGTGKSFSSGFHIGALADKDKTNTEDRDPDAFEKTVDRLEALRVPTIAALNGGVYGGSTDLALACDFRIGVPGMRMFMPAARLGIVYYPSGLRRYVSRLGLAAAKKLFLTSEPMGDDELKAIGYVDEIVPTAHLMIRVEELAAQIAANAPLAVTTLKRALNEVAAGRLDLARLNDERRVAGASHDHQEGLKAWAEKRKPMFKGQ